MNVRYIKMGIYEWFYLEFFHRHMSDMDTGQGNCGYGVPLPGVHVACFVVDSSLMNSSVSWYM